MGELLVLADEHTQLVVVHADVLVEHPAGNAAAVVYIFIKEREHHVRVVHGGFAIGLLSEAIVVVVGLHDFDELVHGVVELMVLRVVGEHRAHLLFGEAHHFVEAVSQ